jgi:hypothetical protein
MQFGRQVPYGMQLNLHHLPDDTIHMSGFGEYDVDILELDVKFRVTAMFFHD